MKDKAPISDFNFSPDAEELIPFDVSTLMQEYADGRRKFNRIDLKGANLSHAHLPYIQLEESLLQKADFRHAILAGSSLNHVDLSASNLSRTNLIAADLIRAKLAGANLTGAFLSGANLSGANLRKTNLTDCTLAGANLSGVDFSGAILKNTNMAGATLRGANLSTVDISELDLTGVSLEGIILSAEQGGATWTALQPGDPIEASGGASLPDPSQGLPADAYPLDAFDSSYEELIQDLSESTEWSGEFDQDFSDPATSEAVTGPDPASPDPFAPQSPLGSLEAEPATGETALDPSDVAQSAGETGFEAMAVVPLSGAETNLSQKVPANPPGHRQEEVIKSIQAVLNRRTHFSLQRKLLEVYGKRCAITGCSIRPLLDTVLIDSSDNSVADHPSNGLVLRTDIKILYNLFLIAVHPTKLTVMLAPSLRRSSYGYLHGQKIALPKQAIYHPNPEYLQAHLDHCKWVHYDADPEAKGIGMATPGSHEYEETPPPSGHDLTTKFALVLAGLVAGSLLTSLLWFFLPQGSMDLADSSIANREAVDDGEVPVPSVTVDPENQIRLRLGLLVFPLGGVIYDESAYLSVAQLQQVGLIDGVPDSAELIQTGGRRFVKASFVQDLGLNVNWDADTRTVTLNCCENPDIEPITIAVEDQTIAEAGLIIDGSSYVPVEALDALNTAQVQVPADNFVGVDQRFYIKSSGLDEIGFDITWNADSRILNIE